MKTPRTRSEPQSRRMTLPKVWLTPAGRGHRGPLPTAKTGSTTGRTSPASSQGTTCRRTSRVAAIFSSSGRARSVVPTTVSRLPGAARVRSRPPATAEQADQDEASPSGQRLEIARESSRADQVEHDVDPRAARLLADDRGKVLLRSVDRRRRAQ